MNGKPAEVTRTGASLDHVNCRQYCTLWFKLELMFVVVQLKDKTICVGVGGVSVCSENVSVPDRSGIISKATTVMSQTQFMCIWSHSVEFT